MPEHLPGELSGLEDDVGRDAHPDADQELREDQERPVAPEAHGVDSCPTVG